MMKKKTKKRYVYRAWDNYGKGPVKIERAEIKSIGKKLVVLHERAGVAFEYLPRVELRFAMFSEQEALNSYIKNETSQIRLHTGIAQDARRNVRVAKSMLRQIKGKE
jgi:hypothetical protein